MSEFDTKAAVIAADKADWHSGPGHCESVAFIDGARWQHSQDQARIAEADAMIERLSEALGESLKSHIYTANEIDKIRSQIFPEIEICGDCEGACSCKYPEGFHELYSLRYHCYGADIGGSEALAELAEWKRGRE